MSQYDQNHPKIVTMRGRTHISRSRVEDLKDDPLDGTLAERLATAAYAPDRRLAADPTVWRHQTSPSKWTIGGERSELQALAERRRLDWSGAKSVGRHQPEGGEHGALR